MTQALTIRTDKETLDELERLAQLQDRSKNYVANQALKAYLGGKVGEAQHSSYTFQNPADLKSRYWSEDDGEAFLDFLAEERAQSLKDDAERDLG